MNADQEGLMEGRRYDKELQKKTFYSAVDERLLTPGRVFLG
jgi:hypothetical protein